MSAADLLYTDTEDELRDSVRRLLADRCPPEAVVTAYEATPADFSAAWKALAAELGLAGLLVSESLGGAGASSREVAVVMEELGRAVAPVPFLSSAVLATVALRTAGETQTLGRLAPGTQPVRWPFRCPPPPRVPAGRFVPTRTGCTDGSPVWPAQRPRTCSSSQSPAPRYASCTPSLGTPPDSR